MLIDSILVSYSNTTVKKFSFSDTTTLISSHGSNTKGKTSLIRFLIWGLGFNVSLTNQFNPLYAETKIKLKKSDITAVNRKGNKLILSTDDNTETRYILPEDEDQVLGLLFPTVPKKILPQLLGFMYFDQDGGYKAWNRNIVTQRLGNDRAYKISIESLLATFGDIDYESYLKRHQSIEHVKNETTSFNDLLKSMRLDGSAGSHSVENDIQKINDEIGRRELELSRVRDKRSIYSNSLRDQNNFNTLLKRLSIKIKVEKKIVSVTNENIIQDRHLSTRLTEFEKHYHSLESKLGAELNSLKQKRDVLVATSVDSSSEPLFDTGNNYKHLMDLLKVSGIDIEDVQVALADIKTASSKNKFQFQTEIKSTAAYSDIWNTIVSLANELELAVSINYRSNRLLVDKITESGAKRSLTVIAYRVGVLRYLHDVYDVQLPLIFDSPASSEMDTENLDMLLLMLVTKFPEFQIIIATNQNTDVSFDRKVIIQNGVVGTLSGPS